MKKELDARASGKQEMFLSFYAYFDLTGVKKYFACFFFFHSTLTNMYSLILFVSLSHG